MTAGTISATASNPRQTKHAECPGGVDIDVLAKLPDGSTLDVEVTLHPAKSGAGVDCNLWMRDAAMVTRLQECSKRARRQVLDAIEYCARAFWREHAPKH